MRCTRRSRRARSPPPVSTSWCRSRRRRTTRSSRSRTSPSPRTAPGRRGTTGRRPTATASTTSSAWRPGARLSGWSPSCGTSAGSGREDPAMANEALRTILPIAGWADERARAVEITGGADPILPTPFRIGETSAAALAAVGLAASDLWTLRTGRDQEVAVDTRQATASLRSGHYMQLDGADVSTERNTVMGVYPAKNGRWSYLHCNFPNHRDAALRVLGVPEDREAVQKAVAQWDALELEEAIIAAKGAGGMVRTMDEWARHPQAAAVA